MKYRLIAGLNLFALALVFLSEAAVAQVTVLANSSSTAAVDCSVPSATYNYEFRNADQTLYVCIEYALDLPTTDPRFGTKSTCAASNFIPIPTSWAYDSVNKRITSPITNLQNSPSMVPGTYYMLARATNGTIYRSNPLVVKRTGFSNCNAPSIQAIGSATASTDCSLSTSTYNYRFSNVDQTASICIDYTINVPAGTPRYGDKHTCTVAEHVKMPTAWTYDSVNKVITSPLTKLRGSPTMIPGTYTMSLVDKNGIMYKSNPLVIRKNGFFNCNAPSAKSVASTSTGADCSAADATYNYQFFDTDQTSKVCVSYALDLPAGSLRYGEKLTCATKDYITMPTSWAYDSVLKKISTPVTNLRNHPVMLPGAYTMNIMYSNGEVFQANPLVVKRPGYENCNTVIPTTYGSVETGTDCSSPNATYSYTVANTDTNSKICIEYELDMPAGDPRYGVKFTCATSNFATMPSNWVYDSVRKTYTSPTSYTRNSNSMVPGKFTLAVLTSKGEIIRSNPLIVKRTGFNSCKDSTTGVPPVISAITSGPIDLGIGNTLTLTVAATGTGNLSYQWYNGTTVVGSDSKLVIPNAQPANSGSYTVKIWDSNGTMTSSAIAVSIRDIPRCYVDAKMDCTPTGSTVNVATQMGGIAPWAPRTDRERSALLGTAEVQGDPVNCMAFAKIIKTECKVASPVASVFFDQYGRKTMQFTAAFDSNLNTNSKLPSVFADYFAGRLDPLKKTAVVGTYTCSANVWPDNNFRYTTPMLYEPIRGENKIHGTLTLGDGTTMAGLRPFYGTNVPNPAVSLINCSIGPKIFAGYCTYWYIQPTIYINNDPVATIVPASKNLSVRNGGTCYQKGRRFAVIEDRAPKPTAILYNYWNAFLPGAVYSCLCN